MTIFTIIAFREEHISWGGDLLSRSHNRVTIHTDEEEAARTLSGYFVFNATEATEKASSDDRETTYVPYETALLVDGMACGPRVDFLESGIDDGLVNAAFATRARAAHDRITERSHMLAQPEIEAYRERKRAEAAAREASSRRDEEAIERRQYARLAQKYGAGSH